MMSCKHEELALNVRNDLLLLEQQYAHTRYKACEHLKLELEARLQQHVKEVKVHGGQERLKSIQAKLLAKTQPEYEMPIGPDFFQRQETAALQALAVSSQPTYELVYHYAADPLYCQRNVLPVLFANKHICELYER